MNETRNFPMAANSMEAGSIKPSKVQTTVCTVDARKKVFKRVSEEFEN